MVISQPACICLAATAERLRRGLEVFGRRRGRQAAAVVATASVAEPESEVLGEPVPVAAEAVSLTATERRARAAAFRGWLLARQRRFVSAQAAFAEAARLDPALDLTTIPGFWELERGGHEAAARAYDEIGRGREATALAARLRQTYRPRLVPGRRDAAATAR